jgi:stage II sporulation protein E
VKTALQMKTSENAGKLHGVEAIVRYGIVVLLAALASNARMIGGLAGMGVAVSTALPRTYSYAAIAGSVLGYVLFGNRADQLVLLPALLMVLLLKMFVRRVSVLKASPILLGALSFLVMLCCGIGASAIESAGPVVYLLRALQAVLCFAVTYFGATAVKAFFSPRDMRHYTMREYVSIGVIGGVFLLALCDIRFFTFTLGRIIGILVVLYFMGKGGFSSAAVAAGTAASFALYSADFAPYGGAMMMAAILASALKPLGKLGQVAVFLAVNTCGAFMVSTGQQTIVYLLDSFFAAAVFAVIPARFFGGSFAVSLDAASGKTETQDSGWLANRLRFAALALHDLRSSVDAVSGKMSENEVPDISSVYHRSADHICHNCGLKMFCWESQYDTTWQALETVTPILKKEGRIREEQMPQYFQNKCCKFSALTAAVNQNYQSYLSHRQAARMVEEAKQVSSEQLDGVAEMLCEIGEEVGTVSSLDDRRTAKVRTVLSNLNVDADEICCYTDMNERTGVEIYTTAPVKVSEKLLCENLSSALDCEFDLPSVTEIGERVKISFFEMARYHTEFHAEQYPANGEQYCGDSYETFLDSKGFFHLVLSDGMGSGGRAAVDSVMTCSFILKLIKAGFGFESAIKLINSSLLVKAPDESLATIDILRLDLYTGRAEVLKAGAAPTFILKGNSVQKLESDSLPVGILKGVGFDRMDCKLSSGDLVLVVSDGVTATGTDWIEAELEMNARKSSREIAGRIASEARRRRIDGHSDDVTVAAIRLRTGD